MIGWVVFIVVFPRGWIHGWLSFASGASPVVGQKVFNERIGVDADHFFLLLSVLIGREEGGMGRQLKKTVKVTDCEEKEERKIDETKCLELLYLIRLIELFDSGSRQRDSMSRQEMVPDECFSFESRVTHFAYVRFYVGMYRASGQVLLRNCCNSCLKELHGFQE